MSHNNMLALVLVDPPAATPVSLAEVKLHCRIDHSDEDALLTSLLKAATAYLDGYTGILGRALVTQAWRQDFGTFPSSDFYECDGIASGVLRLPLYPVASVTHIKYSDSAGVEQTLSALQYRLMNDDIGFFIAPVAGTTFVGWPSIDSRYDAVRVTFVAGVAAASVDEADKAIIRHLVASWYENRESVVIGSSVNEITYGVEALIAARRRVSFG